MEVEAMSLAQKFKTSRDADSITTFEGNSQERKALRKLDLSIIPMLSMFYLLSFLDRTNVGNARVAGLQNDLHLTDHQYSVALTVTFISYVIVEFPATLFLKKIGPNILLPTLIIIWGIITTLQGFVKSYSGLIAARFFLGLAEGGMFPGILLYLSGFYPRLELQTRVALFFSTASLSGAFSGLLAYALVHLDGKAGLKGWSWIFIVEGLFTICWGFLSLFIFPESLESNRFLTPREKTILKQRLERDRPVLFEENERFSFSEVFACLKSPHVLLNSLSLFMTGTVDFSLAYFQPTIVNSLGYSAVRSQLLTIPPSVVSFIVMLGTGFISDRFQARGLTACGCALTSMTGFLIFYVTKPQQTSLKYASLFFSVAGSYSLVPPLQTWQANNSEGHYRRATAIILGACVGNLGGILSTWLFPLSQKPEYHTGTSLNLAFSIAVFVTTLFNLFWLRRLNFNKRKYRDQILSKYQVKEGAGGESELNEKKRAHRELGDQHPDFIYAY